MAEISQADNDQDSPGGSADRVIICPFCDQAVTLPQEMSSGHHYRCPRCGHVVVGARTISNETVALVALSALIMLVAALAQPFMSLNAYGVGVDMSLTGVLTTLITDWGMLLYIFLVVTLFLPVVVLFIIVEVGIFRIRPSLTTARIYTFSHRYCMVDVFMMGVIISLVKLTSLAAVSFHGGFASALVFTMLMVWCWINFRPQRVWDFIAEFKETNIIQGVRGIDQGIVHCRTCGSFYRPSDHGGHCPRCGRVNAVRNPHALQKTLALLLSAAILYMPSNLYPVMFTEFMGSNSGSNIIDGVIALWGMNSRFVAIIILVASIFIPIFKILALCFLVICIKSPRLGLSRKRMSRMYHVVELIGKWSMIDVFVVIIMSAVVRMGGIITINPGFAIVAFCAVVLLTLLSAEELDERLIWD